MTTAGRSRAILPLLGALVAFAGCDGDDVVSPPATLSIQKTATSSGDGQTDTVLATLAPFRVLVLRGTAPAQGVTVSWRAFPDTTSPGATTTTDVSGIAEFRKTLGQATGSYGAVASVADAIGSPVTFTATATPGNPTMARYVSGNSQTDTANARLSADYIVRVTDSHENGVGGVVIDWAVTAGGGSVTPTRTTTAPDGYAGVRHTLGPDDGAQTVTATASALPGAPQQTFTATAFRLGILQVTATTTGVDLDPNGYSLTVDGAAVDLTATLAANETVTIRIRPGDYTVTISGVAVNCDAATASSSTVAVLSGGSAAIAFDVACSTATLLAFVSDALSCDYYGYYCDDGFYDIYTIKSNGTDLTRLTTAPGYDAAPAWSPDGSKLVFTSPRDGRAAIYVMSADGSGQTQLTNDPSDNVELTPSWSPDGQRIAFTGGDFDIYVMNADGTNPVRLTSDPAIDATPAWSPDGTKIAFTSARDGNREIYVMSADGSGLTRLTDNAADDSQPAWSPDGIKIAFLRTTNGGCFTGACLPSTSLEGDIYVMSADGSGPQLLVGSGEGVGLSNPTWSPDGRWIAFESAFCSYYYYGYCYYMTHVIRAVTADGTRVEDITNVFGSHPAWRRGS